MFGQPLTGSPGDICVSSEAGSAGLPLLVGYRQEGAAPQLTVLSIWPSGKYLCSHYSKRWEYTGLSWHFLSVLPSLHKPPVRCPEKREHVSNPSHLHPSIFVAGSDKDSTILQIDLNKWQHNSWVMQTQNLRVILHIFLFIYWASKLLAYSFSSVLSVYPKFATSRHLHCYCMSHLNYFNNLLNVPSPNSLYSV